MGDARSFRKKPVVVQAIQWDGTLSGIDDILSVFSDIRTVAKTAHPSTNKCSFWKIGTLEGSREVSAGDFIIRGVKGEYYPCKPDIFTMTYEPADATPPADAALADRLCAIADSASINSEATQAELSPKQEQAIYDAAVAALEAVAEQSPPATDSHQPAADSRHPRETALAQDAARGSFRRNNDADTDGA